jgi:hypothetical protein
MAAAADTGFTYVITGRSFCLLIGRRVRRGPSGEAARACGAHESRARRHHVRNGRRARAYGDGRAVRSSERDSAGPGGRAAGRRAGAAAAFPSVLPPCPCARGKKAVTRTLPKSEVFLWLRMKRRAGWRAKAAGHAHGIRAQGWARIDILGG